MLVLLAASVGVPRAGHAQGCGNGIREIGEQCDKGQAECVDGMNDGAPCATAADCPGGTCEGGNPPGVAQCPADLNRDDLRDCCRSTCRYPSCGDGTLDTPEACDDGNGSTNDRCIITVLGGPVGVRNCASARCGDGYLCSSAGCTSGPGGGREECDDGNAIANDGCTACRRDICGDGRLSPGERCDQGSAHCSGGLNPGAPCQRAGDCFGDGVCDGGSAPGDAACPASVNRDDLADCCRSSCDPPACGDGTRDSGEACDDGNAVTTDACIVTSPGGAIGTRNCALARCGDGFVCTSADCTSGPTGGREECDDGNSMPGDGCSGCALDYCGDGRLNVGERCDSGQAYCSGGMNPHAACKRASDCLGDGICEGGTAPGGATCPAGVNRDDLTDCCRTSCEVPTCGDGTRDSGEACDDGNTATTDSCIITAPGAAVGARNCAVARCGDGYRCSESDCTTGPQGKPEECDDGNTIAGDGCTQCTRDFCGDGSLDVGERCDQGTALCVGGLNPGKACRTAGDCLGDGVCQGGVVPGDQGCPGGENRDDLADCCRSNCEPPTCGDGTKDTAEACDDGNGVATDPCIITERGAPVGPRNCAAARCGDGIVCSDVRCTSGPDGLREQCDDGNAIAGDGCTDCALDYCGDGKRDAVEQCDLGQAHCTGGLNDGAACTRAADCFGGACEGGSAPGDVNCPGGFNRDDLRDCCRSDCTAPSCGDGTRDTPEQCDDGNLLQSDGCVVTTIGGDVGPLNCAAARCGNGFVCSERACTTGPDGGPEECDDGNAVDGDGCSSCALDFCGDGTLDQGERCDLGDAHCVGGLNPGVLCKRAADCFGGTCEGGSPPGALNCPGGFNRDDLTDCCRTTCGAPHCGDGVVDTPEQCDDGDTDSRNGCIITAPGDAAGPANCSAARCGDGFVCAQPGCTTGPDGGPEACDDGNDVESDGCKSDCSLPMCGDGILRRRTEQCDGTTNCSSSNPALADCCFDDDTSSRSPDPTAVDGYWAALQECRLPKLRRTDCSRFVMRRLDRIQDRLWTARYHAQIGQYHKAFRMVDRVRGWIDGPVRRRLRQPSVQRGCSPTALAYMDAQTENATKLLVGLLNEMTPF